MSKVVLQGLEFHAHHGVFATEGVLGARFVVDAELHYPFAGIADDLGRGAAAAAGDEVADPVAGQVAAGDVGAVAEAVVQCEEVAGELETSKYRVPLV